MNARRLRHPARGAAGEPGGGEAAYTLVEAVVAVTLFTLVAGVVLSLYLVSVRGVARWQEGLALENTLHVVRTRVAEDLRRAERVERGAEGALLLGFADGTAVTYTQRDSTLFRGERLLIRPPLRLAAFEVRLYAGDGDGWHEVEGREVPDSLRVVYAEVDVALADARRHLRTTASAALRKPPRWAD